MIYFHPRTMLRLYGAIVERRYDGAMRLTASYLEFSRQTEPIFA